VKLVLQVRQALLVKPEQLVRLEPLDKPEPRVKLVLQVKPEPLVKQALLVKPELKAILEQLGQAQFTTQLMDV
jgi:hypothetical protein